MVQPAAHDKKPCCGLPLANALGSAQGYHWPRKNLTYRVIPNKGADIPASQVWSTVRAALNIWQTVPVGFSFKARFKQPDLLLTFRAGDHGDGYPFDGQHGTLAHAFFPHTGGTTFIEGDVHFDSDETWGAGGYSLLWVATHELGHSLGLDHITPGAGYVGPLPIMYPYYQEEPVLLTNLDRQALQDLYQGI